MQGATLFDNVAAINCDNLPVGKTATNYSKSGLIVFWLTKGRDEDSSVQQNKVEIARG